MKSVKLALLSFACLVGAYSGTWEANVPGHGKPAFRSMGSQFSEQGFRDMGSQLTGF